ncbi:inositol monophosphatase 3 isoform X2 [Eurytemora carolleeae]|nr:inositol monophosphatase 3 isoform X2 [Eurytemora carolleeae]XP_023336699.1 inositol monophosphatase 3 isoform X2 [Eurytemora carolleeae]XP_023336700.1 inositol monophosphatase 3 isoform X2 [Eurytemora carolleeae]XP_023336701.1 inositol monophosphatase 3 isoform X2 [Eurytemora carolleeae]|eukprot:XP_023336698.1 inositol monophosphatase 3-like isoform X2 [Eurytemora affinis]
MTILSDIKTFRDNQRLARTLRDHLQEDRCNQDQINLSTPSKMVNFGGAIRLNPPAIFLICGIVGLIVFFNMGRSTAPHPNISLKQLLAVSIHAAVKGGIEVVRVREEADIGESSKGKTKEGANDPKTNGDMFSHRAMYWGIKKAFPHINVISEEHDVEEVDLSTVEMPSLDNPEVESIVDDDTLVPPGEISVWIDPLDATQEYTENLRHFVTTMVCVAINGVPVIGIIHKPFEKLTAWGWAGPDYRSKSVNDDLKAGKGLEHDISKARIIVSRSHAGSVNATAQSALGQDIVVTPAGGAGYKAWEVLKGSQDAYVHTTLIKKWDICAGNAILNSAGGQLTTLKGESINYSGVEGNEKNTGGVLATLYHHKNYVAKLSLLMVETKRKTAEKRAAFKTLVRDRLRKP